MSCLNDHRLKLGSSEYKPIVVGGMGVDISTVELALEISRIGGIAHISDAMTLYVSDKRTDTNYCSIKSNKYKSTLHSPDKSEVKFDLEHLRQAQLNHVRLAMDQKKGPGGIFINVMEKLTMADPGKTLEVRLNAALDGGIDGVTLSAGLHTGSLKVIESNPRFHEVKIGIIVSSARALKIFFKSAAKSNRFPDYIIVEGPLAGGHLGFGLDWQQHDLTTIVKDVINLLNEENLKIPVIPAGGIFSGTDAVKFINLGASAVQVATRFTIAKECGLPERVKQEYLRSTEEDVVVNTVSPTGYPMRMLKYSPCLQSNIKPNCEAFGYLLNREGKCPYIDAYEGTASDDHGKKSVVKEKICLCYHFSKYNCYTCGHNVFRLKDTTSKNVDGTYQLPTAEQIAGDYLLTPATLN